MANTTINANGTLVIKGNAYIDATGALKVPEGNTAQRPDPASNGHIRYNTTIDSFEGYTVAGWGPLGAGGGGGGTGFTGSRGFTGSGAAISVSDEGGLLTNSLTSINFTGTGVTASTVGGAVTVSISGGGGGGDGYTGSAGTTGFTGSKGDTGYTGSKGADGTSVTILGSVANEASLPGYPSSYTGAVGDGYIVLGDLYVWNGTGWQNVGPIQGPTGYSGSRGYTGSIGGLGFTGSIGTLGFTGSRGTSGFTGSQGAGFTGSSGFTGSGGIGFTGSTGFTGSRGADGTSVTILGTVANEASLPGYPSSYTGAVGDGYIVLGDLYVWNGSSWQNVGPIQGPAGYNGSVGFVGSRGFSGSVGFTGSIGFTGSKGFTGSVGFVGSVGFTGSLGYSGSRGYTGSGATGFTGSLGYSGSASTVQGLPGFSGSRGFTGFTGSAGVTGFTGSRGTTGFTGSSGALGSQGLIGFTGSKGAGAAPRAYGVVTDTGVINAGGFGFTVTSGVAGTKTITITNSSGMTSSAKVIPVVTVHTFGATTNTLSTIIARVTSATSVVVYTGTGPNSWAAFNIQFSVMIYYADDLV